MFLAIVVVVVLILAGLAVIGYRMGPPPGGRALTERDRRLQVERADQAGFRRQANPSLRSDRIEAVESLAAAAVRMARRSVDVQPSLNATEALADAMDRLDQLERDATEVSLGPLVADVAIYLASVGVLNYLDPGNPELTGLTPDDLAVNPGLAIRIAEVADLYAWPHDA